MQCFNSIGDGRKQKSKLKILKSNFELNDNLIFNNVILNTVINQKFVQKDTLLPYQLL